MALLQVPALFSSAAERVQRAPVGYRQVPAVATFDDAAPGQCTECPAHGLERQSDIFANLGPVHGQINVGTAFSSRALVPLQHLQECGQFRKCLPAREKNRVLLRLSKLLAQFADHMKVQCGVSRQLAAQGGDRNLKCGDGSKCSRRIGVSRALGKPEYVRIIPDRDRNEWVKAEMTSYPLMMCTRPEILQSGTTDATAD